MLHTRRVSNNSIERESDRIDSNHLVPYFDSISDTIMLNYSNIHGYEKIKKTKNHEFDRIRYTRRICSHYRN